MTDEIERKYLVINKLLPKLEGGILYIQGYLCFKPLIRFRVIDKKVILNIKNVKKGGITKNEWEFPKILNIQEIKKLVNLAQKKPIEKIRYKIKYKKLTWEIDVYQGENKGLITTEIEIPSENYQIQFPEWVDSTNEITNDSRYFNINLGDNPYRKWKDVEN